jgi:hypothetical protein
MKMINKGRHYERQLQALETRFEAGDIDYDTYQREAGYIFDVIKTDDSFDNSPDKEKIMDALSAQKTRMDENARNLNFSEAELTPGQSLNFDDDSSVGDSASEISGLSQRDTALPVRNNAAPDTSKLLNEVKDAINGLAPKPSEPKGPFNAGSMGPRALTAEQVQQMEKTSELPSPPTPNDVMRLGATEANSALVIPRGLDQIRSDIEFDMFSVVRPGFGLGADNKMFAFENIRDKEIIGKGPLFLPRAYDGPTGGVNTVPVCLQNVVPTTVYEKNAKINKLLVSAAADTRQNTGKGSLNVLGDDYGQLTGLSDRGLNRPAESYLEPVIRIDSRWQRPKLEPGYLSSKRQFRRLFDCLRYPEHVEPHMFMNGGPTMKKARSALEVLL